MGEVWFILQHPKPMETEQIQLIRRMSCEQYYFGLFETSWIEPWTPAFPADILPLGHYAVCHWFGSSICPECCHGTLAQVIVLLTCILKVLASNLSWNTVVFIVLLCSSMWMLREYLRLGSYPFHISFPIRNSLIIIPFSAVESEGWTFSNKLNK